jgi:hypothetical protein
VRLGAKVNSRVGTQPRSLDLIFRSFLLFFATLRSILTYPLLTHARFVEFSPAQHILVLFFHSHFGFRNFFIGTTSTICHDIFTTTDDK